MESTRAFVACALAASLICAAGASAGPLTSASWVTRTDPFALVTNVPITARGAAVATDITLNGCACVGVTVPDFRATAFIPKTSKGVLDLAQILTLGGAAHITATRSRAHATQGIAGSVVLKTAMHAVGSAFQVGAITLLRVPLSVGAGGTETGTFTVLGEPHSFTAHHYAWTAGTVTFMDLTSKGVALPDVTLMGSFFPPFDGQNGTVMLVAPTRIDVRGPIAQRSQVASFSRLRLNFIDDGSSGGPICVPEPGVLLLLGAGAFLLYTASRRSPA